MNREGSPLKTCEEIRPSLEAYHDGEVTDAANETAIEDHLRECGACREELKAFEALDERLRSLPKLEASEALKREIRGLKGDAKDGTDDGRTRSSRPSKWMAGAGVAAVVMLGVVAFWAWSLKSEDEDMVAQAEARDGLLAFIEDHVAYVQSEAAPVRQTDDASELERWFGAQLEFRPELPRWAWAELVSGRLCFIHGRRVARVHYRGAGADLTLFIQQVEAGKETQADSSVMERTLRGYRVGCWKAHGLDYVLVAPSSAAGKVFEKLGEPG